jgi:lipopolysaccharide transport system permease protein
LRGAALLPFTRMSRPYYTNEYPTQLRRLIPDLVRARELWFDLVWKDVRIRYRYAALGLLWAVLEPLFMMLVLTFVISVVFELQPGRRPDGVGPGFDAVFILSGLLAWQFLAAALTSSARSLIDGENLVTKVNFPREVLPLAAIGSACVNLIIGAVLLSAVYLVTIGLPPASAGWAVALIGVEVMLAAGLGLLVATLNLAFRDVGYITNAALLFGFYATPVFYSPEFVQNALAARDLEWLYPVYFVNPMAGLITGLRQALFYQQTPDVSLVAWPVFCAIALFATGLIVFRRRAGTLSDQV